MGPLEHQEPLRDCIPERQSSLCQQSPVISEAPPLRVGLPASCRDSVWLVSYRSHTCSRGCSVSLSSSTVVCRKHCCCSQPLPLFVTVSLLQPLLSWWSLTLGRKECETDINSTSSSTFQLLQSWLQVFLCAIKPCWSHTSCLLPTSVVRVNWHRYLTTLLFLYSVLYILRILINV